LKSTPRDRLVNTDMVQSTQVVTSEREIKHQTQATLLNATGMDFQEIIIRQFV